MSGALVLVAVVAVAGFLLAVAVGLAFPRDLAHSAYPAPDEAEREMDELVRRRPDLVARHEIGRSIEGRPIHAYRMRGGSQEGPRPRLLVTSHIHACEYVGSFVARAVARRLVEAEGKDADITALLARADVWFVPLLNPDGAWRVRRARGRTSFGWARFTAQGVDPNRNFPFVPAAGRAGWNTGRNRPGSAFYRGPHPLSEPECLALARLAHRERFVAAINFHSFGCVVFLPEPLAKDAQKARAAIDVFRGRFQSRQVLRPYRPVDETASQTIGQLDPFLLGAFGTVSVTVEVSRPGWHLLAPWRTANVFWWSNPPDPRRWARNDVEATITALRALLDRMDATPCIPAQPELADQVPLESSTSSHGSTPSR